MKRIFNTKNFVRAFIFGVLALVLYSLANLIFGNEINVKSNSIKASILFIAFLFGSQHVTWKQLFFGKKKTK